MKYFFHQEEFIIIITSLVKSFTFNETTDCYILEHLNITRLSKRCNDKKNIYFKYSFFSENPAKIYIIQYNMGHLTLSGLQVWGL